MFKIPLFEVSHKLFLDCSIMSIYKKKLEQKSGMILLKVNF